MHSWCYSIYQLPDRSSHNVRRRSRRSYSRSRQQKAYSTAVTGCNPLLGSQHQHHQLAAILAEVTPSRYRRLEHTAPMREQE
jgi:hypothetical protein